MFKVEIVRNFGLLWVTQISVLQNTYLAHWGFFLTPHPKPLLRASFCANKKFQSYYGKTAVFRFDVESRENIVPIKKTTKKQRFCVFWRFRLQLD